MASSSPDFQKRRWLGSLLSLIIPGFGLMRAGMPGRGACWLLSLHLWVFIGALSLVLRWIPLWVPLGFLAAAIIAQIWVLYDSFRPGRMTMTLWLLFIGLLAATFLLPTPASWVAISMVAPIVTMEPTLHGSTIDSTADHVIVDRLSYRFDSPKRGDLIVYKNSKIGSLHLTEEKKDVLYVQRLVGLPGERLRIAGGKIFADGRLLGEKDGIPPITYTELSGVTSSARREGDSFVLGPEEYFVLGDNSPQSYDSRFWGCVPASDVYGKLTLIYYPLSRARRL